VVSAEDRKIILTWDPVVGANEYKIQVFLNVNKYDVLHTQYVPYPIAEVTGLQPDTAYIFRVTAVRGRESARRSSKGEITFEARSMKVGWSKDEEARRYGVVLYEEEGGDIEVVMEADNIATPELKLDGLKPGTTYTIAVQSAKPGEDLKDEIAVHSFTTPLDVAVGENVFVTKTSGGAVVEDEIVTEPAQPTQLTNCQEAAMSKIDQGEELHDCRSDGNYVTVRCSDVTDDVMTIPEDCWCVDAVNGEKVPGSDFNMEYLQKNDILLNCDTYGTFAATEREIFIKQIFPDKITVGWGVTKETRHQITAVLVRVYDEYDQLLQMVVQQFGEDFTVEGLSPEQYYEVSVQAVNDDGASTGAGWNTLLEFTTIKVETIEKPLNVKVKDTRHIVNSNGEKQTGVELSWDAVKFADFYRIRAINRNNPAQPTATKIFTTDVNRAVVTNLSPFVPYDIEISAHGYVGGSDVTTVTVDRLCMDRPLDVIFAVDVSWIGNGAWINFHYKKRSCRKSGSGTAAEFTCGVCEILQRFVTCR